MSEPLTPGESPQTKPLPCPFGCGAEIRSDGDSVRHNRAPGQRACLLNGAFTDLGTWNHRESVPLPTVASTGVMVDCIRHAARHWSARDECDLTRPILSEAANALEQLSAERESGASLGALDGFGLPCDESPERNTVCDLLTKELLVVGETAYHAGEKTTLDLRDERDVRGLLRYLTAVHSEGRDGPYGERKQVLWRELGRVLSPKLSRTAQAILSLLGGAGEKGIPKEKLAPMLYMADVIAREYLGHPITDIEWTKEMLESRASLGERPGDDYAIREAVERLASDLDGYGTLPAERQLARVLVVRLRAIANLSQRPSEGTEATRNAGLLGTYTAGEASSNGREFRVTVNVPLAPFLAMNLPLGCFIGVNPPQSLGEIPSAPTGMHFTCENCREKVNRPESHMHPTNFAWTCDHHEGANGCDRPAASPTPTDTDRLDLLIEWLGHHDDLEGSGIRDWDDRADARKAIDAAMPVAAPSFAEATSENMPRIVAAMGRAASPETTPLCDKRFPHFTAPDKTSGGIVQQPCELSMGHEGRCGFLRAASPGDETPVTNDDVCADPNCRVCEEQQ